MSKIRNWMVFFKDIGGVSSVFLNDYAEAKRLYEIEPHAYAICRWDFATESWQPSAHKTAENPYPAHTKDYWDWENKWGTVNTCI